MAITSTPEVTSILWSRKEAAMGKTWKECRNCKNTYRSGSGNLLCGLRDTAGDGLTAITRRERAAETDSCYHFEAKDPIADLNDLPGNVPAMRATTAPDIVPLDIDPMKRPLWEIDPLFLDPYKELPPVLSWCKMGERPAIDRNGIITFSAKPKQGKSLAIYAILTAIISGKPLDTITPTASPRLAVVFDTEMNEPTLQGRAQKIITSLGEAAPRFLIVPLLKYRVKDRKGIIEDITAKYAPDIVVIDQIAKMVTNYNDPEESAATMEWLSQYAADRTVLVVIHQNKAADNKQMKGHLGSLLEQEAVENYTVDKSKGVFKVTATNARNSNVDEAAPFTFTLDDDGNIISAADITKANAAKEYAQMYDIFAVIFGNDDKLSHKELITRLRANKVSETTAENQFTKARELGVIAKAGEKQRDPYILVKQYLPKS